MLEMGLVRTVDMLALEYSCSHLASSLHHSPYKYISVPYLIVHGYVCRAHPMTNDSIPIGKEKSPTQDSPT